jgi:hypothetical protein
MWCSWCGTLFRKHKSCPRGPGCAKEEANHNWLMQTIAEIDPTWRVK